MSEQLLNTEQPMVEIKEKETLLFYKDIEQPKAEKKERERLFFYKDMPAKTLTELLFLTTFYKNIDKEDFTGSQLQGLTLDITENLWSPCDDTTYKLLNSMESESFVTSYWIDRDKNNKRDKRLYSTTDKGLERFKYLKSRYMSTFQDTIKTIDIALKFLFNNKAPESADIEVIKVSSKLFQEVNLLQYLKNNKGTFTNGKHIREGVKRAYTVVEKNNNTKFYWESSVGVAYPILSDLATEGYLDDRWSLDEKKKKEREYCITTKGIKRLEHYTRETNLYHQLINIQTMFKSFYEYIYSDKF